MYVVPYTHLDTQWRWEFPQAIGEYPLKTMRVNFEYIDEYPHYVFNWTGANRYRLMKEYFPADYERMKRYIGAGRWYPAGSSMEEGDVNLPSAEGIIRHIEPVRAVSVTSSELKILDTSMENARYRVHLNSDGDVSSIYDKSLKKELLSAPIQLAISADKPRQWPAWNMDFDQEQAEPRAFVRGPGQVRIVGRGPVRVALEVAREAEGSKFVERVSLSAGDVGNRVEFANAIDWRGLASNVKATFPLSAANQNATYNWDIGTIERQNSQERQFEVGSHRWIDLTDTRGADGVTILTDCKNGSDKPDDHTIRLTLLRSPGIQPGQNGRPAGYTDQANQDWGHHDILFGLAGHAGDWRRGGTDWQAYRMNDPLIAFATEKHAGSLGRSFSLVQIENPRIRLLALKKAETSDEIVVRMVEMDGAQPETVKIKFAGPITNAREVNGQELPLRPAKLQDGALVTWFGPYQPRTFAIRLGTQPAKLKPVTSQPVPRRYDLAAASNDDTRIDGGGFDGKGRSNCLPAITTECTYWRRRRTGISR